MGATRCSQATLGHSSENFRIQYVYSFIMFYILQICASYIYKDIVLYFIRRTCIYIYIYIYIQRLNNIYDSLYMPYFNVYIIQGKKHNFVHLHIHIYIYVRIDIKVYIYINHVVICVYIYICTNHTSIYAVSIYIYTYK